MNSKFEILRKVLKGVEKTGKVESGSYNGERKMLSPAYPSVAQEVASDLLEIFPEEDSEHVKAYRALYYLIDYLDEHQFEGVEGCHIDKYQVQDHLHRMGSRTQEDAIEDVLKRLEVDTTKRSFGSSTRFDETTIHDPVSKVNRTVSQAGVEHGMLDKTVETTAQEVLEAPL